MIEKSARYQFVGVIARGGMAEVALARRLGSRGFTRMVVIKRPLQELEDDAGIEEMLRREAQVMSLLHHPNIVQVYDFDEIDGKQYLVMEAVEGVSAARLLASANMLPVEIAAYIALCTAEGLHAAHELCDPEGTNLELVHRDVSPDNILLDWQGHVKVADFGIALTVSKSRLTSPGNVKGKFAYMSPEQIRGDKVDRRSDVYALGATLYKLLTGHSAFHRRETDAALMYAALHEQPPPLPENVPPKLAQLILRTLAKNPDDRPSSAAEFASELAGAVQVGNAANLKQVLLQQFSKEHPERQKFAKLLANLPQTDAPTQHGRPVSITSERAVEISQTSGVATHKKVYFMAFGVGAFLAILASALALTYGMRVPAPSAATATGVVPAPPPAISTSVTVMGSAPSLAPASGPTAEAPPPIVASSSPVAAPPDAALPAVPSVPNSAEAVRSKRRPLPLQASLARGTASPSSPTTNSWGRLAFSGSVGCALSLDGRAIGDLGTTPLVVNSVPAGLHTVRCRGGPLQLDFDRELSILEGESKSLSIEPQRATLVVKVAPWGEVFIDGKLAGTSPLEPKSIYEGRHTVEAVHPSGARVKKEIALAPGESQTVRLILKVPQ